MSTEPGLGLPIADEAREALEAARREHRELTETERAIAGAELGDPAVPEGAALEAIVRTPVLESAGPLVIMTRQ